MGLDYSDARPSYLNLELCVYGMFENSGRTGHGRNLPEQLAGSRSRSGRNRGAAVEADAIGEQQTKRPPSGGRVEADAIREQQTKRTPSGSRVEADAIESSS